MKARDETDDITHQLYQITKGESILILPTFYLDS